MRFVWSRPCAWAWLTRKATQSTERSDGVMQPVTFLSPTREIPAGCESSIVRSSGLDNAKSFPLTAALGRIGPSARRGGCGRCMPIRREIGANRIRCRCPGAFSHADVMHRRGQDAVLADSAYPRRGALAVQMHTQSVTLRLETIANGCMALFALAAANLLVYLGNHTAPTPTDPHNASIIVGTVKGGNTASPQRPNCNPSGVAEPPAVRA
jgi:hypothetical protein